MKIPNNLQMSQSYVQIKILRQLAGGPEIQT